MAERVLTQKELNRAPTALSTVNSRWPTPPAHKIAT